MPGREHMQGQEQRRGGEGEIRGGDKAVDGWVFHCTTCLGHAARMPGCALTQQDLIGA